MKSGVTLKPCPFCGRQPKQGLGKVTYCQLHGDPSQDWIIWCDGFDGKTTPHARILAGDQKRCSDIWNNRFPDVILTTNSGDEPVHDNTR